MSSVSCESRVVLSTKASSCTSSFSRLVGIPVFETDVSGSTSTAEASSVFGRSGSSRLTTAFFSRHFSSKGEKQFQTKQSHRVSHSYLKLDLHPLQQYPGYLQRWLNHPVLAPCWLSPADSRILMPAMLVKGRMKSQLTQLGPTWKYLCSRNETNSKLPGCYPQRKINQMIRGGLFQWNHHTWETSTWETGRVWTMMWSVGTCPAANEMPGVSWGWVMRNAPCPSPLVGIPGTSSNVCTEESPILIMFSPELDCAAAITFPKDESPATSNQMSRKRENFAISLQEIVMCYKISWLETHNLSWEESWRCPFCVCTYHFLCFALTSGSTAHYHRNLNVAQVHSRQATASGWSHPRVLTVKVLQAFNHICNKENIPFAAEFQTEAFKRNDS